MIYSTGRNNDFCVSGNSESWFVVFDLHKRFFEVHHCINIIDFIFRWSFLMEGLDEKWGDYWWIDSEIADKKEGDQEV